MKDDRPGLEKDETVLLEHWHLAEGLQCTVIGLVLVALLKQPRAVRQAGLFQCPAHAQVAHLPAGEIRDPFESGNRDHLELLYFAPAR